MKAFFTKGKWRLGLENKKAILCDTPDGRAVTIATTYQTKDKEEIYNAILISKSPLLLETIIYSYLELLVNMPMEYRCTTSGQLLLAQLITSLEFLFDGNYEETQDYFEDLSRKIKRGETTVYNSVKQIIK